MEGLKESPPRDTEQETRSSHQGHKGLYLQDGMRAILRGRLVPGESSDGEAWT